jgi:hypothetical protein
MEAMSMFLPIKKTSERTWASRKGGIRADGADRIRKSASRLERICCDFTFSLDAKYYAHSSAVANEVTASAQLLGRN